MLSLLSGMGDEERGKGEEGRGKGGGRRKREVGGGGGRGKWVGERRRKVGGRKTGEQVRMNSTNRGYCVYLI